MTPRPAQAVDVVGLGYCSYDILAITPYMPQFDDVVGTHLADLVYDGGGPVGTALTALARLGARAGYVGVLGDDHEGRQLRDLFEQEGVDLARLRVSRDVGTNLCLILVEQATAHRAILCRSRVDKDALVLDETDRAYVEAARVLHLDGQFMPAAIEAASWARAAGVKVCLDANHPRPGLDELLPLVDWLVVAGPFPAAQTGFSDPGAAARVLLDSGVEVLVVTQGAQGCRVWTQESGETLSSGEQGLHVPGFQVEAEDTTGAGDAFHGGFIYGMLQGWPLPQAATFANAVAALNCQTLGGRRGLPNRARVDQLLAAGKLAPGTGEFTNTGSGLQVSAF